MPAHPVSGVSQACHTAAAWSVMGMETGNLGTCGPRSPPVKMTARRQVPRGTWEMGNAGVTHLSPHTWMETTDPGCQGSCSPDQKAASCYRAPKGSCGKHLVRVEGLP